MKITIPETPSHIRLEQVTTLIRSMGLIPTINRQGDLVGLTPRAAADLGRPAQRTANVTPIGRGRA
jgi:hypothetical protein